MASTITIAETFVELFFKGENVPKTWTSKGYMVRVKENSSKTFVSLSIEDSEFQGNPDYLKRVKPILQKLNIPGFKLREVEACYSRDFKRLQIIYEFIGIDDVTLQVSKLNFSDI